MLKPTLSEVETPTVEDDTPLRDDDTTDVLTPTVEVEADVLLSELDTPVSELTTDSRFDTCELRLEVAVEIRVCASAWSVATCVDSDELNAAWSVATWS